MKFLFNFIDVFSKLNPFCIPPSLNRPGRPKFIEKLRQLLPGVDVEFMDVAGTTCTGDRNELICGKDSTTISSAPKELTVALLDLSPSCLK